MVLRKFLGGGNEQLLDSDTLAAINNLLLLRSRNRRYSFLLDYFSKILADDVRGFIIIKTEQGLKIGAILGYKEKLREIAPQFGPWQNLDQNHKLILGNPQKLYANNSSSEVKELTQLGLLKANSSMVFALDRDTKNILVLHRQNGNPFSKKEFSLVKSWVEILQKLTMIEDEKNDALRDIREISRSLVTAIESLNFVQLGHAERVTNYALAIGKEMKLGKKERTDLYLAAMLHDIGKMGSNLKEDKDHPIRGINMLESSHVLKRAIEGIRSHHENWDGTGYPQGLKDNQIPLLARIIAVANTFDLLSSERGQALPMREVEKAIKDKAGSELDPTLTELFINILRQGKTTSELQPMLEQTLF